MRISNNIMALNTHRFYTMNNNQVSKSAEKLSSGYRVNRAGDDAAGLAISEKMRAEIRGLSMASKNAQDAVSMVQTAEGALTEVQSMLQRMKELAVQASSDSNDDEIDRTALNAEYQQLILEIDDIANSTTFNDMKLLDGTFTGKKIQVGSRTGNEMEIEISSMKAADIGASGDLTSQSTASAAVDACRTALNAVSTQRATLGAMQNRLEHKINNLNNTVENVSAAESRIRDVDIAQEMTNFTKNQILSQAATAMLAQANALPQNVLQLLR